MPEKLLTLALVLWLACAAAGAPEGWLAVSVPGPWERVTGLERYDGPACYRCFVRVPAEWRGSTLTLALGQIDEVDETYVNGRRVGGSGSPARPAAGEVREYRIEPEHVRFGAENLIAVRVWDQSGPGGILRGPVRLGCERGALGLEGRWQIRTGADPAWTAWPSPPEGDAARTLAVAFRENAGSAFGRALDFTPLPGTRPLTEVGDLASHLVAGVDRFLLREIERAGERRERLWKRDFSSPEAYSRGMEPYRRRLAHLVGVRDPHVPFEAPELVATLDRPSLVGRGAGWEAHAVRWSAFGGVHGEGLLLTPTGGPAAADVIALPDADQTPEELAGLAEGTAPGAQFARRLAESGCRVLVPVLVDRRLEARNGRARLTSREFLYRSAFELGRHLIGYELQKVLAAADWMARQPGARVGVFGRGEGGLLALHAGALDPRIAVTGVSGYFDDRSRVWQEPIDRSVWGRLEQFADAELAAMIAPRALVVEAARAPELELPGQGGAPARLDTPPAARVRAEFERARELVAPLRPAPAWELAVSGDGTGLAGSEAALRAFLEVLRPGTRPAPDGDAPQRVGPPADNAARQQRQMRELDRHSQELLVESPYVRQEFMKRLDASSPEKYRESSARYREQFAEETIGRFDLPLLKPNPRTRKSYDTPRWTGYEVVLDVFPDVIAYGVLLVPKDLRPGERRPVVVCQHGLEGRPQDVISGDNPAYHDFAAKLAERGFITFAPQNLYLFGDRFRTLQRKANPLRKSLFSVIVPQHQQIVDWLQSLPMVDPERVAFYGLSYGGKSAMRIPALVTDYCLSICSADFNEWVWKNASTRSPYSYVWTGEYEIFEFDLGSTFNYAEMAALIAPRPFMVERGHFDGVAPDEAVAHEFAKVRHLYAARLGIGGRCEIEFFVGPHTINGKGTFDFLHRHLRWPAPPAAGAK